MSGVVAIAGCPNSGKTSLFNQLTGAKQKVGNWPGQTVERYAGEFTVSDDRFEIVDLPGTYGLVAVSAEEGIASCYLMEERPDVVVTVVDASNLNGSLHLVAQIAEAGLHQVVALNMIDVADRRGIEIDERKLEQALGIEVVRTVARKGRGVDELKAAVARAAESAPQQLLIEYSPVVERHIAGLVDTIVSAPQIAALGSPRWTALQLLASDVATRESVALEPGGHAVLEEAAADRDGIAAETGFDAAIELAEYRFNWISELVDGMTGSIDTGMTWSDRADRVLTHRRKKMAYGCRHFRLRWIFQINCQF